MRLKQGNNTVQLNGIKGGPRPVTFHRALTCPIPGEPRLRLIQIGVLYLGRVWREDGEWWSQVYIGRDIYEGEISHDTETDATFSLLRNHINQGGNNG